jgi:hypothetical protein
LRKRKLLLSRELKTQVKCSRVSEPGNTALKKRYAGALAPAYLFLECAY